MPDPTDARRRRTRGLQAGAEVRNTFTRTEAGALQKLQRRLNALKAQLEQDLVGPAATAFRTLTLRELVSHTTRLIAQTQAQIERETRLELKTVGELGAAAAEQPVRAAQVLITRGLGLDTTLVDHAADNVADLLSEPMQQFRNRVVASLRRVSLTGQGKFEEIAKLRDVIAGAGFDAAHFRAERIVRTEVSRVFNGSAQERLSDLADASPFVRKCWRSARDHRVRQGHLEAAGTYGRGNGIPADARFVVPHYDAKTGAKVGIVRMRFPVDPDAEPAGKLAAASTINCRCGLFVDVDINEFRDHARQRISFALGLPREQPIAAQPRTP